MNLPLIRLFCDISPGSGHNHATRGLVQALEVLGYDMGTLHCVGAVSASMDYASSIEQDWFRKYVYAPWPTQEHINLVHLNPGLCGDYWTAGRFNIAYCAWETDALPKQVFNINGEERTVVGDLNKYDAVWVPSEFLVGIFKTSGVTVPISVVPHALQHELISRPFVPMSPCTVIDQPELQPVCFYHVGSWNARKDIEMLLRAYLMSGWSMGTPVRLHIHAVPHNRGASDVVAHQIVAHEAMKGLAASATNQAALPSVGLFTTPKSYAHVLEFHEKRHVFVTASHGEGFGFGLVEALALGRIAIGGGPWVDDIAERLSYADLPYHGRCLDRMLRALPATKTPITPMPECRGYELDQNWWTVDRGALLAAMRDAYHDVRQGIDISAAEYVAKLVRSTFSPEAIAEIVRPLLPS